MEYGVSSLVSQIFIFVLVVVGPVLVRPLPLPGQTELEGGKQEAVEFALAVVDDVAKLPIGAQTGAFEDARQIFEGRPGAAGRVIALRGEASVEQVAKSEKSQADRALDLGV